VSGNTCASLAATWGLTVDDIEDFNKGANGTWGWNGCKNLMAGMNMCLSTGKPPMPAPVWNAICGPTVPRNDSDPIPDGVNLADLNPCPLNVCCNIWGQCGMTDDFCLEKRGETGD